MTGYFTDPECAGYALVMYELYHIFVASLAQLIVAVFPTVAVAQVATGFVWFMVNTFNGPLSPPPLTPTGWCWFYVSPLFYFVEGLATNAMHGLRIGCSGAEVAVFHAPTGLTCGEYAADFFAAGSSAVAAGHLVDEDAMDRCEYRPSADGDEYVSSVVPLSSLGVCGGIAGESPD